MDSIIKVRELDYDELMKCLTDWIVNGKYTVTGEAIDLDKILDTLNMRMEYIA